MNRRRKRALRTIAFFCLLWPACMPAIASQGLFHGHSRSDILERFGPPTREIATQAGALLIYGSVFMEVARDTVIFVNVPTERDLERRRALDAEAGVFWGRDRSRAVQTTRERAPHESGRRPMTLTEQDEWLEARQKRKQDVVEFRVRRFVVEATFRDILDRLDPYTFISGGGPRFSIWLPSDPAAPVLIGASSRRVSFLHLKDARAMSIPACGEDSDPTDWQVIYGESVNPVTFRF